MHSEPRSLPTSRSAQSNRRLQLAVCLALGMYAPRPEAKPPLPTPCVAGNCSNGSPFLQYGTANATVSGTTLTVSQSTAQAILNWANFNIASGYKVTFNQPSATASALNQIWSADPSVIAGALKSNGIVYLYNQNGIVFDKGAQVDVGGLVATSLGLRATDPANPTALYQNGILTGGPTSAVFQACSSPPCAQPPGNVIVNNGAQLETSDGGRIMLLGSAVTNAGSIVTPDGQAILGAGNQVFLAASTDPALRGLLIAVNAGAAAGAPNPASVGTVANTGTISAPRGNVTLAGLIVNQSGTVSATTSVSANGSVFLVAGDTSNTDITSSFYDNQAQGFGQLLPDHGGTLTLAPGSRTEVLPDATDTGTITRANLGNFEPSQIELVGNSVALRGDAAVKAPGGLVEARAAGDPEAQFRGISPVGGGYVPDGGRVYLDQGSTIDVSGLSDVPVPVTQNILTVRLESNDLQDDPLLRNGFLHGENVVVDARQGSTLFNLAPYVGNIGEGIGQVLTAAGAIHLQSNGDVIMRSGATLNVSGGSVSFEGANAPALTTLQGADGHIYSITNAPTTVPYVGFANTFGYTDPTWGTQTNFTAQTYYPGYVQGGAAGSISVLAPQIYLRGSLLGSSIAGPYQRTTPPPGGLLQLGCPCINLAGGGNGVPDYDSPAIEFASAGAPDVLGTAFDPLTSALPATLPPQVVLSTSALTQAGFDRLQLFSTGAVTLPAGTQLDLAPFGSLSIQSLQAVEIAGSVRAPGGTIALATPNAGLGHGIDIDIAPGASLDVSGTWVNDSPLAGGVSGLGPIVLAGGSISLNAAGNLLLGNGSLLDVSGGGWVSTGNQLHTGAAGNIALSAVFQPIAQDSYFTGAVELGSNAQLVGDSLNASGGGALSLVSSSVVIGGAPTGAAGELALPATFFDGRGFKSYSITGEQGLTVGSTLTGAAAVRLAPIQETLVFTGDALTEPTGASLASFTQLESLPQVERSPVSLTLATSSGLLPVPTPSSTGPGVPDSGAIFVGRNASILTDPGSSVTLQANSSSATITVLGDITAPAGQISLLLGGGTALGYLPGQEILIGSDAALRAPGYALVSTLNALGLPEGAVLGGGTISLQANKGYVVTQAGSVIDVSGTATTLDVVNTNGVQSTLAYGNAGSIAIDAREGLSLQGALLGHAATSNGATVAGAGGGTLSLGLDLYDFQATIGQDAGLPPNLVPFPSDPRTVTLTGRPVTQPLNLISVPAIEAGGFDNLTFKSSDVIAVDGAVSLSSGASVTLDAPLLAGNPGSALTIHAPYVALGNYFNQSDYFETPANTVGILAANPNAAAVLAPGCGGSGVCSATLRVNSGVVDLRGVSGFSGFSSIALSSSGDIRLVAPLNQYTAAPALQTPAGDSSDPTFRAGLTVSGDLRLSAQQIYPTTLTDFTLTTPAALTIAPGPAGAVSPLTAGGSVTLNAQSIEQLGVLRAPLGEITFDAPTIELGSGSTTSVAATGLVPFGSTLNGQQWVYAPNSILADTLSAPPAKTVALIGSDVAIDKGATLDLSGGGDLLAYEWIAGPGGSTDVLATGAGKNVAGVLPYQYAIVPTLGAPASSATSTPALFAPLDREILWQQGAVPYTTPNATAQSVYLSGIPGLAAGYYVLLPARYAVLPGAYALRVLAAGSDLPLGSSAPEPNGSYVVAGRFAEAGTGVIDARTSTFLVAPSAVVNAQSQYNLSYANSFFSAAAASAQTAVPRLPADSGVLTLAASARLVVDGAFDFAPGSYTTGSGSTSATHQGLGGIAAIDTNSIEVVDSVTTPAPSGSGPLQLSAAALDDLGAQTLLLGGSAQQTATGEEITAVAQTLELANSTVALKAPEVILAARNLITLDSGAQLGTSGSLASAPATLVVNGVGALLRVAAGPLSPVTTESATASDYVAPDPQGRLQIGASANLSAAGSLLLYSTGNSQFDPSAAYAAPGIGVYSSQINLGAVPQGTPGSALPASLLEVLSARAANLTLSGSSIDFYGPVALGSRALQGLTLDTGALQGHDAGASPGDVTFTAGSITLENSQAASPTAATDLGNGSLALASSGDITLGPGTTLVRGFAAGVSLGAKEDIQVQGTGQLLLGTTSGLDPVPLSLTATALTAAPGATVSIATGGAITVARNAGAAVASGFAPGGAITITGSSITSTGTIDLPAGELTLHATGAGGDLVLGSGSVTGAPGSAQSFTVTSAVAPGGTVTLESDHGNVQIAAGATVDVSGGSSADGKFSAAGALSVAAPNGEFLYAGSTLLGGASGGAAAADFSVDVQRGLSGPGFEELATALARGGFTGALSLRTRADPSVETTGTVVASSFELSADTGNVEIAGTIDTSGTAGHPDAGPIAIWGSGVVLAPTASLIASAYAGGPAGLNGAEYPAQGGDITLGSSDAGRMVLEGGRISALGAGTGRDGTVTVRAFDGAGGLQLTLPAGGTTVEADTHNPIVIEGFRIYQASQLGANQSGGAAGTPDVGCGTGGSCDVADLSGQLFTDAYAFVGGGQGAARGAALAQGFSNTLGSASPVRVQVRPGVEIQSAGDLTLGGDGTAAWDLDAWNAALGAPVNVTLRASGNLVLEASISDGFTNPNTGGPVNLWSFGGSGASVDAATGITSGVTASYRLTAGADLSAASPLATVPAVVGLSGMPASGNLVITPGSLIRTGDGRIDARAGGDLLLGYAITGTASDGSLEVSPSAPLSAALYTAGVPTALSAAQQAIFTQPGTPPRSLAPAYPADGGDVSVSAGQDLLSAPTSQTATDWLWRQGQSTLASIATNTSWWVEFNDFDQGIGALGGGDIALRAGGNVVNVSAAIPTTGRLLGAQGTAPLATNLVIDGGGALSIAAGGDIRSGVFEDDWGNAQLTAGGALASGTTLAQTLGPGALTGSNSVHALDPVYPVFLLGSGAFDATARTGLALNVADSSTALPPLLANRAAGSAFFYQYTPASAVLLQSVSGNVVLDNTVNDLPLALNGTNVYANGAGQFAGATVISPPTIEAAALNGNLIVLNRPLSLFPAAQGQLALLAEGSITGSPTGDLTAAFAARMYESSPDQWPTPIAPVALSGLIPTTAALPLVPLHESDPQPVFLVAETGSIGTSHLTFPKAADVVAGEEITDLALNAKNLGPSDVTLVEAGGNVQFSTPLTPGTTELESNNAGVSVAGPGYLEVLAGGSLSLGDSNGIVTTGSLSDARLPTGGATIVAGAGFGAAPQSVLRQPDSAAFIKQYLAPAGDGTPSAYSQALISYIEQLEPGLGNLSYAAALADFDALTPQRQLPLLANVLMNELSQTGLDHTLNGASYARGYTAIATLFPSADASGQALSYQGDINLYFSQIKTEQNGDIRVLAPGGSVVVGVPNPPASLTQLKQVGVPFVPAAANLGILVLGSGTVEGFADQSFEVNTSRILTLEGGDIVLWATNGDIDAGRGAKSASAVPPPVIQTDAQGNVFVNPINDVSGSGIGLLLSRPGEVAGLVNLIAPKGTVNAGEAGIRAAGNLNIAAVQVIGASNITVGGTASGVPVSEAGALSGALSGANAVGDASKNAVESLASDLAGAGNFQQLNESLVPTFIEVKLFCLGVECAAH